MKKLKNKEKVFKKLNKNALLGIVATVGLATMTAMTGVKAVQTSDRQNEILEYFRENNKYYCEYVQDQSDELYDKYHKGEISFSEIVDTLKETSSNDITRKFFDIYASKEAKQELKDADQAHAIATGMTIACASITGAVIPLTFYELYKDMKKEGQDKDNENFHDDNDLLAV